MVMKINFLGKISFAISVVKKVKVFRYKPDVALGDPGG
jgi:hypothetical protein